MSSRFVWPAILLFLLSAGSATILAATGTGVAAEGPSSVATGADARIERHVARRLAWDAELAPFDIDVAVNDGIVRLSGAVSTATESHQAFRIADQIKGVSGVVNAIRVDEALEPYVGGQTQQPSDAELEERIREVLDRTASLAADQIAVSVEDGHVRLSGKVVGVADRVIAGRIVRSLFGVRGVVNDTEPGA